MGYSLTGSHPVHSAMSNLWSCSRKYSVMKQTELPKKKISQGEGGLFIKHLIVLIWACHCKDIMGASAIIILHIPRYKFSYVWYKWN